MKTPNHYVPAIHGYVNQPLNRADLAMLDAEIEGRPYTFLGAYLSLLKTSKKA